MKYLIVPTVGICMLLTSVPAMADQAEDEAAIREIMNQRGAAFNRHDVKALGAQLSETYESWTGNQKGRAGYEKYTTGNFKRQKDLQVKLLEEIGIVFVTPDVAIYKYRTEFTGGIDANGNPQPPGKSLSARVFVKKDGKWLSPANFSRPIEE